MKKYPNKTITKDIMDTVGKIIAYIIMVVFTIMTIYPIFWLVINSFKTTVEFRTNMVGLPINWTLQNYPGAWKIGEFNKLILNSFLYTSVSIIGGGLLENMEAVRMAISSGFEAVSLSDSNIWRSHPASEKIN